ncbi:Polynucleotide 5'-hydroxyl-kinase NOL9 [Platanthera guangdongensis]|uniref:Polynucleotide 5'-hydroxyl-kinase NOL9 n=1 Tax=Platanthera guangdongensis TaxID=2320717 RepID=A0ABR2M6G6_9ASPA
MNLNNFLNGWIVTVIYCVHFFCRCVFFGHVSAKQDSKSYSSCVNFLYDYFCQEFYMMREIDNPYKILLPLTFNTSMWVKSTSYEILVAMLRHISPTPVVNVCFPSETENFPSGQFWLENSHRESVNLVQIFAANESSIQM